MMRMRGARGMLEQDRFEKYLVECRCGGSGVGQLQSGPSFMVKAVAAAGNRCASAPARQCRAVADVVRIFPRAIRVAHLVR